MKSKKTTSSTSEDQAKSSAEESVKNLSDLGKTELVRKKRVDPEI